MFGSVEKMFCRKNHAPKKCSAEKITRRKNQAPKKSSVKQICKEVASLSVHRAPIFSVEKIWRRISIFLSKKSFFRPGLRFFLGPFLETTSVFSNSRWTWHGSRSLGIFSAEKIQGAQQTFFRPKKSRAAAPDFFCRKNPGRSLGFFRPKKSRAVAHSF